MGEVGKVLEGEVSVKHPIRQNFLRGVMVEVQLQEGGSAYEQLLHLGRPPLPPRPSGTHDALVDARYNLARWQAMESSRP